MCTLRYVYAQDMVYMSSYCMELTSVDLEVRVRPGHGVHVFLLHGADVCAP